MKESLLSQFKGFLRKSKRVFLITKKPSLSEWYTIAKITGVGILAIGLIGFILTIAGQLYF